MKVRLLGAAALIALAASAGHASASVVVDQDTFTSDTGAAGITHSGMIPTSYPVHETQLQTVTAGVTGTLTELDLKIEQDFGTGNMELLVFNGGYLGAGVAAGDYGNVVADKVFSLASLPQNPTPGQFSNSPTQTITSFDLSSFNFHVTAGQVFSFSVRSAEPYGVINSTILTNTSIPYAGGTDYLSSNIGLRYLDYGTPDVQFRTYVDDGLSAAAVPEPASWAMMLLGFFGLGAGLRARRRCEPAVA